jgi:hypothetical protein
VARTLIFKWLFQMGDVMTSGSKTWFSGYRTDLATMFELAALEQSWRKDLHELEGKRIARDVATVRRMQEATRAADWQGFCADAQSALRDYLSATAQIWQDSIQIANGNQGALVSALERASGNAFAAWREFCRDMPGFDAADQPAREWMSIFERMMTTAGASPALASTVRASADKRGKRVAQGEQHVE